MSEKVENKKKRASYTSHTDQLVADEHEAGVFAGVRLLGDEREEALLRLVVCAEADSVEGVLVEVPLGERTKGF